MQSKIQTKKIILEKITRGEIRMKPRWWFVAWAAGLKGGVVMLWLLGALAASGLWYWWDVNNPRELVGLGDLGWEVIKSSLPYWLVTELGVLLISGGILYSSVGENYKKTTKVVVLVVAGVTMGLTILMTLVRYQKELELWLRFI